MLKRDNNTAEHDLCRPRPVSFREGSGVASVPYLVLVRLATQVNILQKIVSSLALGTKTWE